jgi:hypothetical protein
MFCFYAAMAGNAFFIDDGFYISAEVNLFFRGHQHAAQA